MNLGRGFLHKKVRSLGSGDLSGRVTNRENGHVAGDWAPKLLRPRLATTEVASVLLQPVFQDLHRP